MESITEIIKNNKYKAWDILKSSNLLNEVISLTSFLDSHYNNVSWSQRFWHIRNGEYKIIKCICGKPSKYITNKAKYVACSRECKHNKYSQNIQEKFGVNNYFKTKKFKVDEIKKNREKFGVDFYIQTAEFKEKSNKTIQKRYGVKNAASLQRPLTTKRILSEDYILVKFEKSRGNIFIKHLKCGNIFEISYSTMRSRIIYKEIELCTVCNPLNKQFSYTEKEIKKFLPSNITIHQNDKSVISPKELDIFLPDFNLAIEFNGSYWHSELYKDKNYHQTKSKICQSKNIQLIQIWDYDWIHKQDIVKSIINGYLGRCKKIYARKCILKTLTAKDCRNFINRCHIQGFVPATIYYGLYRDNELVQIMSFKKIKNNDWEISRLCSKLNTIIVGGTSKLFKHFINNITFNSLISYNNNDYFSGKIYEKLDMKMIGYSANYKYINNQLHVLSRQSCQKHKLIRQGYDPNKTEHEIMLERGYYRVYNSGNKKYQY